MKKRFLCILLAISLIFTTSVIANADVVPFPGVGGVVGNLALQSISNPHGFTLIEGGASASSAVTGGAAALMKGAVPVLAVLVAAGVIYYSTQQAADDANTLYTNLSEESRAKLDALIGADSFNMDAELRAELSQLISDMYYVDGELIDEAGITFDPSSLLKYDYDKMTVFTNEELDASILSIYNHPLSYQPVALTGTSLTVQLIESPFQGYETALQFVNTATGVILQVTDFVIDSLVTDHGTLSISLPFIELYQKVGIGDVPQIGIMILEGCPEFGHIDCDHTYKYSSNKFVEGFDVAFSTIFQLLNTGLDYIDNIPFHTQNLNPTSSLPYLWNYVTPSGSSTSLESPFPYTQTAFGTPSNVRKFLGDPASDVPANGDQLYLPTPDVLKNINYLTPDGVMEGDWDKTIPDANTQPDANTTGILSLLKKILDAILSIPELLLEGLKKVFEITFLPSDGFLEDFVKDISGEFEGRMGILTYPVSVLYDFLSRFSELDEQEPILKWNEWRYQGTVFIPEGEYNLNDILENETINYIHELYLRIVDAGMIFGLLALFRKKFESVISN